MMNNNKIGVISLGCDKNRVDTENMLFLLGEAGFCFVDNTNEADIMLINTCGFIESAKKESIDTILEIVEKKKQGIIKYIIISGCLVERYSKELFEEIKEVDAFVGISSEKNIVKIIENLSRGERIFDITKEKRTYTKGRITTTPMHYAYLRISDGCDKNCSYCAIPGIRGRYHSICIEDLLEEAIYLIDNGAKELILVAQDVSCYGKDIYGKPMLKELMKELIKLNLWKIRLLYVYPENIDKELIKMISQEEKIAKYIDIPLQHINEFILKRMNRKTSAKQIKELLNMINETDSDIAIRSTFIVGFNGEDRQKYKELKQFVKTCNELDYFGFFGYSIEEGTPASEYKEGNIEENTIEKRLKELEKIRDKRIKKNNKKYLGKTIEVIYEGIDYDKQCFYGRNEQNSPEIDTLVYFVSEKNLQIGNIYFIKILSTKFDLYGKVVGEKENA